MLSLPIQKCLNRRLHFLNPINFPLRNGILQHESMTKPNVDPCILEMLALLEQQFLFLVEGHFDRKVANITNQELKFLKLENENMNWIQLPSNTDQDSLYNDKLNELMVFFEIKY